MSGVQDDAGESGAKTGDQENSSNAKRFFEDSPEKNASGQIKTIPE
jgi:hypothetical protein